MDKNPAFSPAPLGSAASGRHVVHAQVEQAHRAGYFASATGSDAVDVEKIVTEELRRLGDPLPTEVAQLGPRGLGREALRILRQAGVSEYDEASYRKAIRQAIQDANRVRLGGQGPEPARLRVGRLGRAWRLVPGLWTPARGVPGDSPPERATRRTSLGRVARGAMKYRARHDLQRRLGRLEEEAPEVIRGLRVGHDHLCDWSTEEEFAKLAKLAKEGGLPLEAEECQVLVRRAWGRRARKEPRSIGAGLLFEEGRIAEAEEELRRRRVWELDRRLEQTLLTASRERSGLAAWFLRPLLPGRA